MPTWRQAVFALALGAVVVAAMQVAWFQEFTLLSPWDDEGYFMLAIRYVLDGHRLYDEVRVFYGPFYFLIKWLLHGPLGLPLSHDVVRFTAVGFRLATAAASGWLVFRLTRNTTVAIVAVYVMTVRAIFFALEPGHPQELVALLTVMLPLAATLFDDRPRVAAGALGVLVACLGLVKINVGLFAAVAVATSLLATVAPNRIVTWMRAAALATAVLLPWLLVRSDLARWSAFALLVSGAGVALAPVVLSRVGHLEFGEIGRFVAGAAGTLLLAVGVLGTRSSLVRVLDCLVVYPQSLERFLSAPPPPLDWAPSALVGGIVGSLAWSLRTGAGRGSWLDRVAQIARLAVGACIVLRGDATALVMAPFAWLVLVPPSDDDRESPARSPRLVLAWLAVMELLQIFPLPGSQVVVGTQPMLLVGLVCCGDGARWLTSCVPRDWRASIGTAAAASVLAGVIALSRGDAASWRTLWARGTPLALSGASRLRARDDTAQATRALLAFLRAECSRFVVFPGWQSLYFWADASPPAPVLVPQDTRLMADEDVERLLAALDSEPAACLVRCETAARAQSDPRLAAAYAHWRLRRTFAQCSVFDRQPR